MKTNKFKMLAIFCLAISSMGCLVPGAPHHFGFRSISHGKDSIDMISYSNRIRYRLFFENKQIDSVFVLDPIANSYKKMKLDTAFGDFRYAGWQKAKDVKEIEKLDTISIKFFERNRVYEKKFKASPAVPGNFR